MFQHGGWYVSRGAVPYVDFWDLKPPLVYAVTAALAVAAGGDVLVLHALSVLVAAAAVLASVALVGRLAHDLTGDGAAAFAAGLTILVVPATYGFPPFGIRPKYLALCFGVWSLFLAVRDRPAPSGAAAALGAGFHQQGAGIAALVVAIAASWTGRGGVVRAVGGGLLVAVAVVLPFALADALVPLFVETVLAPAATARRYTLPGRVLDIALELGYGTVVIPVAVYGWFRPNDRRVGAAVAADGGSSASAWWVPVGGALYGSVALFVDLEGSLDMILWLPFLALGVGSLVASLRPTRRVALLCVLGLLVVSGPAWDLAPDPPLRAELENARERHDVADFGHVPDRPSGVPDVRTVYWEKRKPDTCHYRLSEKERVWVHETGGDFRDARCGEWPGKGPPSIGEFGVLIGLS